MDCSFITSGMTWSFSRISAFDTCRYGFFLRYIKQCQAKRLFFADYGSFVHAILGDYLSGKLKRTELSSYYLSHFKREVCGVAPNSDIYLNYFNQGLDYLENISFPVEMVVLTEALVDFDINGNPFTGYIDSVLHDGSELCINDHKSRDLKPRSDRAKPTKTDVLLDEYLRQLYLYSIPINEMYGRYPDYLMFNCYRTQKIIKEPFRETALETAKLWSVESINKINTEEDWAPNINPFRCKYLCDVSQHCEYFKLYGGGGSI